MFKKSIIVLLLLVTPFAQAQAVVACAMMDAQTIVRCCCPGEDHPSMRSPGGADACCVVEVKVAERQFVAPAAQSTPLPAKGVWSEAPVVAILPTAPFDATIAFGVSPSRHPSLSFDVFPTPLYLRTARLRL